MENRQRIKWLDASRGLAFLMIIYSHIDFNSDALMRYFTPVYLTTFFFVSGYLFKEHHSFLYVLEQRTRTLLVPFLIFGFIMILMGQILTFHTPVSFPDAVKGLLYQNGQNQILWFIAALYVYSIAFYWIERWAKTPTVLLTVSFALFILNSLYIKAVGLHNVPWHVETMGFACFYMGVGKWYKEKERIMDKYIDNRWFVMGCLAVYIAIISAFKMWISYDGSEHVVDALVVTLSGLCVMIYLSKHLLNGSRFLLFVGANTLFYFAFHVKSTALLQEIVYKTPLNSLTSTPVVSDLLAFTIVIISCLLLAVPALLVNRYCPWMLGKGFKLWKLKE